MRTAIRVSGALVGATGLILLILGLVVWAGHARALIPLHMLIGLVFVLAMWWVAALAARAGAPKGLVWVAVLWGAIVLVFGMVQQSVLPGPAHWVVRVLHLLLGLGALGIAGVLGKKAREADAAGGGGTAAVGGGGTAAARGGGTNAAGGGGTAAPTA